MHNQIQITKINDFIFCPYSVYLHTIYDKFSPSTYRRKAQTRGKLAHKNIDVSKYSTSKRYLQGIAVYSEKYNLTGNIDIYDKREKALVERKYKVKKIYDGYKYQLFAQYFCMKEMGYDVKKLIIHSLSDNKRYKVGLPQHESLQKFKQVIKKLQEFDPDQSHMDNFDISPTKCGHCIYSNLCTYGYAE